MQEIALSTNEVFHGDVDTEAVVGDAARLVARARKVLANGEVAMSARPLLYGSHGVYPQFIARAEGCRLIDTTGQTWIDWVMGWGTQLLGYGRPEINQAIQHQLIASPTLSMPNALEVEVAERLISMVPNAEMVAFGKNGSDVVTAAVRLARATTRRDVILQYGFHGFHDWFAAGDPGVRGIPSGVRGLVHPFPYNDLAALEALIHKNKGAVAAILMEPFRSELPKEGFLEGVRDLAHRAGALLIFDEMVTGFRSARGGAQALTGISADLVCFGKALSNGMPVSALAGPRDLMRSAESVGVDMGCRGETLSLAAAKASLDIYAQEPVAERVAAAGNSVRAGIEAAARNHGIPLRLAGHPSRMEVEIEDVGRLPGRAALGLFIQGCLDRGVMTNGLIFPSPSHDTLAVQATIDAATEALAIIRLAAEGRTSTLPPPFGPSSRGFIDGATSTGETMHMSGWLLPSGGGPETVELIDDHGSVFQAALGDRPDVLAANPNSGAVLRCGWSVSIPLDPANAAPSWTLRSWRGGRIVFRARIVAGIRSYQRSFPRQLGDGHVVEV